jgi:hypothetical protein
MLSTESSFAASRFWAILGPDAAFHEATSEFRELCCDHRPKGAFPQELGSLLTDSCQAQLREGLADVLRGGELKHLQLFLRRTGREPLALPTLLIPNPKRGTVQAFFLSGGDPERHDGKPYGSLAEGLNEGLLVLRPDGDLSRMVVGYSDALMARSIAPHGGSVLGKTLYQIFTVESTEIIFRTISTARMCQELRQCTATTRQGRKLRLTLFPAERAVLVLGWAEAEEVPLPERPGGANPFPRGLNGNGRQAPPDPYREALKQRLESSLQAVSKLCDSLDGCLPMEAIGRHRVTMIQELTSEMANLLERKPGSPAPVDLAPRKVDVVSEIIGAVETIARPALEADRHQVICIDEMGAEMPLHSTYPLETLQQIAIDLIGDASRLYPSSLLTFRIHPETEHRGWVRLNFEISAEPQMTESRSPFGGKLDLEFLRSRPIFRACRRFLRVVDSEIDVRTHASGCTFRYSLPFSRPVIGSN